jgi:hypothetical protein
MVSSELRIIGLEERSCFRRSPPWPAQSRLRPAFAVPFCCGGEGGIRTPDTVARMPHFECGAFNHSATSPSH